MYKTWSCYQYSRVAEKDTPKSRSIADLRKQFNFYCEKVCREGERESQVDYHCPPSEDLEVYPAEHHGCPQKADHIGEQHVCLQLVGEHCELYLKMCYMALFSLKLMTYKI